MKLDTGKAWSDAVSLISKNRDAVLAVAGLFFFLPPLAFLLLLPEAMAPQEAPLPDGATFEATMEAMQAQMMERLSSYWWITVVLTVLQWFGTLSLFAMLVDRDRPTVGEAMSTGGRGLITYIVAQILVILGISLIIGLPLGIVGALGGGVIVAILLPVLFVFSLYIFVKMTLIPPVIAIEGQTNPIAAIKRSWALTKGNSLSLFLFLLLLTLAAGIIAILVTLVLQTVFAAVGGTVEQIAMGFVESAVSAVIGVVLMAAIAAVYRQLSGPTHAEVSETFE